MIGIDTNVLVARVIPEHPMHDWVSRRLIDILAEGDAFAISSVILSEFIHVVTDPRRFEQPLSMAEALRWAEYWSSSREVAILAVEANVQIRWLVWLDRHKLGRKRLIDTLIAATWHVHGVSRILTLNPRDFEIFRDFSFLK